MADRLADSINLKHWAPISGLHQHTQDNQTSTELANPYRNTSRNSHIEATLTEELKLSLAKQISKLAEKLEVYKLTLESQINRLTYLTARERVQITEIVTNLTSRVSKLAKCNLFDDRQDLERLKNVFYKLESKTSFINKFEQGFDYQAVINESDEINLAIQHLEQVAYDVISIDGFIYKHGFPSGYGPTVIDNLPKEHIDNLYSQIAHLPSNSEVLIENLRESNSSAETKFEQNRIAQLCRIINLDRENLALWLRDYFSNYLPLTTKDANQNTKPSKETQEIIVSKRRLYQLIVNKYPHIIPQLDQIHKDQTPEYPEIRDLLKQMINTSFITADEAKFYHNIPQILPPDFLDWFKTFNSNRNSTSVEDINFNIAGWEKLIRIFQDYTPAIIEIRALMQAQLKCLLENGSTQIPITGTFIEYILRCIRNVNGAIPHPTIDDSTGQLTNTFSYENGDLNNISNVIEEKQVSETTPQELKLLVSIFFEFVEKSFKLAEKCNEFIASKDTRTNPK